MTFLDLLSEFAAIPALQLHTVHEPHVNNYCPQCTTDRFHEYEQLSIVGVGLLVPEHKSYT